MKTIIAGSRYINDGPLLLNCIKSIPWTITEVVCGMARGVDTLGEAYGITRSIPIKYFPAEWGQFGKSAGYLRNKQMTNYAEALLAIWDGDSKGTKHMIDLAESKGLTIAVYNQKLKYLEF